MVQLEVCANSVESAIAAQQGGAFRVELCRQLEIGGTTPSYADIIKARKLLHIKLFVLIRPRGGNFIYTDEEFQVILNDIQFCADNGCDGVVVGILNADGNIDKDRCRQLVQLAQKNNLGTTFHRAFDECADQFKALEEIIELGFDRILTSGGEPTAPEGIDRLSELVIQTDGRIIIMPGSGINESNAAEIVKKTGVTEIHSSARIGNNTDEEKVRSIIQAANS